jgi:hypothetical protein
MNLESNTLQDILDLVDLPSSEIKNFLGPYIQKFGKIETELTTEDIRLILSDIIHDMILES